MSTNLHKLRKWVWPWQQTFNGMSNLQIYVNLGMYIDFFNTH